MILRDYCVDWIIGWVVCWIAFMSVFFSSRKTSFKKWLDTSSIPLRHLAICRASQALSYHNPNSSSTPGGLIEKVPVSSIASRQLGRSIELLFVIWCFVPRHMLDTFIYRDLLMAYIFSSCDPQLIFVDLSLDTSVFSSPKPLSLTPIFFLKISSSFFKFFLTW